jgi:hypothetical protein
MTLSLVMHPELVECTLSSSKGALSGLDRDWLGGGSSQGSTLDGTRGEILRIGPERRVAGESEREIGEAASARGGILRKVNDLGPLGESFPRDSAAA